MTSFVDLDPTHPGGLLVLAPGRSGASVRGWLEWPATEAYLRLRVTNARTEGYNRKIKQIKRVSCVRGVAGPLGLDVTGPVLDRVHPGAWLPRGSPNRQLRSMHSTPGRSPKRALRSVVMITRFLAAAVAAMIRSCARRWVPAR